MKFIKILALILSVCLLGAAFVACDKGGESATEADTAEKVVINVKVIVKDGNETKYEDTVKYEGTEPTLGNIIDWFCEVSLEQENAEPFDANGLLTKIGELEGSNWVAYYEDKGSNNKFDSIKSKPIEDGKTVIIVKK